MKALLLCLPFFAGCGFAGVTSKSPLVNKLEGIFYAEDFADIPDQTFDATDFGAIGDSTTLNTSAIQDAIDDAAEACTTSKCRACKQKGPTPQSALNRRRSGAA